MPNEWESATTAADVPFSSPKRKLLARRCEHKGIRNEGNSCYMAAVLQLIIHCLPLKKLITNNVTIVKENSLIKALNVFFADYGDERRDVCSPQPILQFIHEFTQKFSLFRQEDAEEFLSWLLNTLNNELSTTKSDTGAWTEVSTRRVRKIQPETTSALWDLMGGHLKYTHGTKISLEPYLILPLDLHTESKQYFSYIQEALEATSFVPGSGPILIVHLKRFAFSQGSAKKVAANVHIDRQISVRAKHETIFYTLQSVVSHVGQSAGYGHYVATIYESSGLSYLFDDERVLSCQDQFYGTPYILLYERTNQGSKSEKGTSVKSNSSNSSLASSRYSALLGEE